MDITATIALAKAGAETLKAIRESIGRSKPVVTEKLFELNDIILRLQEQLREAHAEITNLTSRVNEQGRALEFKEKLEFDPGLGVYWREEWPYCPNCWEAREPVASRLQQMANGIWSCPIHRTSFSLNYTKEPHYLRPAQKTRSPKW